MSLHSERHPDAFMTTPACTPDVKSLRDQRQSQCIRQRGHSALSPCSRHQLLLGVRSPDLRPDAVLSDGPHHRCGRPDRQHQEGPGSGEQVTPTTLPIASPRRATPCTSYGGQVLPVHSYRRRTSIHAWITA